MASNATEKPEVSKVAFAYSQILEQSHVAGVVCMLACKDGE